MCITTRPFGPGIDCAGPAGLISGGRYKVHVGDTPLADFQIVIRQLTRRYPRSITRCLCRGIDRLYQGVGHCSSGPMGRHNFCRWREPPVASPKKTKGPKGRYNPNPHVNFVAKGPISCTESRGIIAEIIWFDPELNNLHPPGNKKTRAEKDPGFCLTIAANPLYFPIQNSVFSPRM